MTTGAFRYLKSTILVVSSIFFTSCLSFAQDEYKIPKEYFEFDPVLVSRQELKEITNDVVYIDQILIDTRDAKKCLGIASRIPKQSIVFKQQELCVYKKDEPYLLLTRVTSANMNLQMSSRRERLALKTKHLYQMGSGLLSVMSQMPSEVTKWEEGKTVTRQSWRDNAFNAPVKDEDHWATNYVGHPYAGATYYVAARQSGFNGAESLGYAFAMSTVMWEYGIEAYFENPSIQDLINTPLLGALVGEQMYRLNLAIEANGGEVAGSKRLGSVLMVVTDPATAVENLMESMSRGRYDFEMDLGIGPMQTHDHVTHRPLGLDEQLIGLHFKLRFGRNNKR